MSTNHWVCLAIGVAIGFFVLPAVLQAVQGNRG
jgi:hypothetical protein